jgi:hypothetical protein
LRKFSIFSIHALSLLVLTILAALNWSSFEVSAEIGQLPIAVSGFSAFPAIGSLMTLQAVSLALSTTLVGWVSRVLSAALVPLMVWLLFAVVMSKDEAIQEELSRVVLESTGVAGVLGQQEFIESTQDNHAWVIFVLAVVVNIFVLFYRAIVPLRPGSSRSSVGKTSLPEDLWGSQR